MKKQIITEKLIEKFFSTIKSYFFVTWIITVTLFSVYKIGYNVAVGDTYFVWAVIAAMGTGALFYVIVNQKVELCSFYRNTKPLGTAQLKRG